MSVPEFDINEILAEAKAVLNNKPLPPPAHTEESFTDKSFPPSMHSEDIHHPSEQHAKDAATAFERSIQGHYVLVFFENKTHFLNQSTGRERINLFKNRFSDYINTQVSILRSKNKSGEADILERTDSVAISEVFHQEIEDKAKRIGREVPGSVAYDRIDLQIKALDRWEKFCDELINFEKSGGNT